MTNQMIDGLLVPRELPEQCLAGCRQCDRDRLRALLNAPAPEVDGEQWYADTPDGDGALVTRVVALCNHPSMSFHQVALLEGAISESKATSKPAAQPAPSARKLEIAMEALNYIQHFVCDDTEGDAWHLAGHAQAACELIEQTDDE